MPRALKGMVWSRDRYENEASARARNLRDDERLYRLEGNTGDRHLDDSYIDPPMTDIHHEYPPPGYRLASAGQMLEPSFTKANRGNLDFEEWVQCVRRCSCQLR